MCIANLLDTIDIAYNLYYNTLHAVKNFQFSILNFKFWTYLFIGLFVYLYISAPAGAACIPVYGGGPTCTNNTLTIQKQVLNPSSNTFVNNLGLSDPKYHANDLISFQLTLTNTGSTPLQSIVVKDNLPGVVSFADGPGKFDDNSHILTFTINSLAPHHSQLYTITGHITPEDTFPQSTFCVTNSASALASSGSVVQDSSQFCMEKLKSTPATGPEGLGEISLLLFFTSYIIISRLVRKAV